MARKMPLFEFAANLKLTDVGQIHVQRDEVEFVLPPVPFPFPRYWQPARRNRRATTHAPSSSPPACRLRR